MSAIILSISFDKDNSFQMECAFPQDITGLGALVICHVVVTYSAGGLDILVKDLRIIVTTISFGDSLVSNH